ncbi:MAG: ABC transporter ATP-binding protein [Bryobacterales bacterium]
MEKSAAGLRVEHLTKQYPTPAEPLVVLRDVSFSLEAGEALAIMGPSGSGKSSLLYILGALEKPTSGSVIVAGENPLDLDPKALAAFRNRKVGFIFQDHHLLPQCTALENVLIPTLAEGSSQPAEEAEQRGRALLDRVGLSARADHRPAELSGGERQRVAIARALIQRPPLLLADEPTGNLDRRTADHVADLLLELQREEGSVMTVVTHSAELAQRFARRAELIEGGLEPL